MKIHNFLKYLNLSSTFLFRFVITPKIVLDDSFYILIIIT